VKREKKKKKEAKRGKEALSKPLFCKGVSLIPM